MSIGMTILIAVIALAVGLIGGFFGARKYMETYLQKNPPINEDMLRMMMVQMGQKPSEKKLHQMMSSMNAQAKNSSQKK
ncbi:YneF family protein [Dellaglioa sp. L3N]